MKIGKIVYSALCALTLAGAIAPSAASLAATSDNTCPVTLPKASTSTIADPDNPTGIDFDSMTEDEAIEALFNVDPSFIDLSSEMETDEDNLISPTTEEEQAFIGQLAAEMEFVYTNATTMNAEGTLETIDLNVLRAQYGDSPIFDEIEEMTKTPEVRDLTSYLKCVGGGLLKSVGITALKKAFNKSAIKALKSFAWKKASSIIFNNLVKIIGKKATQFVIKKVAHSILPGSLAVTLGWNAAKCLPKLP